MSTRYSSFGLLFLWLSVFVSKDARVNSQAVYCYDESECANTVFSGSNVYCYGYKACQYSEVEATSVLICGGFYGCYGGTLSAGSSLYCSGYYSCYNSDVAVAGTNLFAYGYYGIAYSYIIGHSSGTSAYIYDAYAAYSTELIYFDNIQADGRYSLYSSYINSGGLSSMTVNLDGYFSGYNSVIYCIDETVCNIGCGYYGCYGATVICYDTAECHIDCDEDCVGYCPTVYNVSVGTSSSVLPQHLWMETLSAQKKALRDELKNKRVEMVNHYGEQDGNKRYLEWLTERDANKEKELTEEIANLQLDLKPSIVKVNKDNEEVLAVVSSNEYLFGALLILMLCYIGYGVYHKCYKNNNKIIQDNRSGYGYQSIA